MVTVIVPVYNVAPFIERCARSLFEQSLNELEFIFVDDCSSDSSASIIASVLNKYPERAGQVRIIKMQSNSGSAAVRKEGILQATGDYIIHCDGDDWVDAALYERMYETAIEENADIVVCDEIFEYANHSLRYEVPQLSQNCKDVVKEWYCRIIGLFCHNKMVRRSLYTRHADTLPWDGLNMWEDNGMMARLFYYGERLAQIHGCYYYHYNRSNNTSLTASYGEREVRQMLGIAEHLTFFFQAKDDGEEYKKTVMAFQFLAKINLITDSWDMLKLYKLIFPGAEKIASELDVNAFSKKGKIRFYMVKYHCAWLFVLLYKLFIRRNSQTYGKPVV